MIKNALKAKFKVWLLGLFLPIGSLIGGVCLVVIVLASVFAAQGPTNTCDATSGGGNSSNVPVNGDWTHKGTSAYNNAKEIFDHLTKKQGFSGAGGSGAVAVANRESGFDPQAKNPGGGVAGVFQWSGWDNTINGNRIHSEGSIKGTDSSTLTMSNEMKLVDFELKGAYKKTRQIVGTATDPTQAALDWSVNYEGVALSDGQTNKDKIISDAKAAYILFDGASIPDEIIDTGGGDDPSDDDQDSSSNDACDSDSAVTDGDILPDKFKSGGTWKPKDLPEELKKYAHDPKALGLQFGNDSGWDRPGNQCIHLTVSYFNKIWDVVYTHWPASGLYGYETASQLAKQFGGKVSKNPVSGAAFQIPAGQDSTGSAGHTGIVDYVFKDGTLMITEQNYHNMSGEANGTSDTWNFRLVPKSEYGKTGWGFYALEGQKAKWGK